MHQRLVWIFFLCFASLGVANDFPPIKSADSRNALVELYTSESCKSCPPAEGWFSKLKTHPKLWTHFVPVAFHINVWDYLGWKDPWASSYYTQRLRENNVHWKSSALKTPVFAVNGVEWKEWKPELVVEEVKKERAGPLSLYPGPYQQVRLEYEPELREHKWVGHVALVGLGLAADIKKGPNAGKQFPEDFVVLAHHFAPLKKKENHFYKTFRLRITPSSPPEVALIAWVTRPTDGVPLQAVGGPISLSFLK